MSVRQSVRQTVRSTDVILRAESGRTQTISDGVVASYEPRGSCSLVNVTLKNAASRSFCLSILKPGPLWSKTAKNTD